MSNRLFPDWDGQICKVCHQNDHTHYVAPDNLWLSVVPPGKNVVCLGCFDALATQKGINYKELLTEVGFVGRGCNYRMIISRSNHKEE